MSRVARIVPSEIYSFDSSWLTLTNESNMFTNTDSDTYAIAVNNSTTYSAYVYVGGFNFSQLPSSAIVESYSLKWKLAKPTQSGMTLSTRNYLRDGSKDISGLPQADITLNSSARISKVDNPLPWADLIAIGDDLNVPVYCAVNNTTHIYGVEFEVVYDVPVNKVVYGTTVLVDLTGDTVTPADLAQGITAHDKSGASITGTLDKASGSIYQDADGYLVVDDSESSAPQGNLSITANGTYDVSDYAGASVAIPMGMSKELLKSYIQRGSLFTDIDWPDGLTSIGSYAFAGCVYFNPSSLPDGIEIIRSHAFRDCSSLALTSLPSGVYAIGTGAFYDCHEIAFTSLPNGITYINQETFYDCWELALTSLPSGVTTISQYGFYRCKKLALTSLPSSLTGISNYAFAGCSGLVSISCDGAITNLAQYAFNGISNNSMSLVSVSFPNMALTSNLSYAFGQPYTPANACQLLEFCDIGSTTGIAANAFANCYKLQTLVLRKSDSICTLTNVSAFLNTPLRGYNSLTGTVYVPQALISTYQTATNWSELYNAGTVTFAAIEGSEYERD